MKELDKKLEKILDDSEHMSYAHCVEAIRQAFVDEGWHEHGTAIPDSVAQKLNIMTGREWYARFQNELQGWVDSAYSGDVDSVMGVARKASGIDE